MPTKPRTWAPEPPPKLRRGDVVKKAIEVLDAEGFDGLSMRRLADALGIKAASLYNHVRDKDELLAHMAEVICEPIPPAVPGDSWRKQLETLAAKTRRAFLAHRDGARVVASTPPLGPNRSRLIEQVLSALVLAGFRQREAAAFASVLNSFLVGFVLDETMGRPVDPEARKRGRDEARTWFQSLNRAQFPTSVAMADALVDGLPDTRFALGVTALLDGLELRVPKKKRK